MVPSPFRGCLLRGSLCGTPSSQVIEASVGDIVGALVFGRVSLYKFIRCFWNTFRLRGRLFEREGTACCGIKTLLEDLYSIGSSKTFAPPLPSGKR